MPKTMSREARAGRMRQMREAGFTLEQIGQEFEISKQAVFDYLTRAFPDVVRSEVVEAVIETEAFIALTKQARVSRKMLAPMLGFRSDNSLRQLEQRPEVRMTAERMNWLKAFSRFRVHQKTQLIRWLERFPAPGRSIATKKLLLAPYATRPLIAELLAFRSESSIRALESGSKTAAKKIEWLTGFKQFREKQATDASEWFMRHPAPGGLDSSASFLSFL